MRVSWYRRFLYARLTGAGAWSLRSLLYGNVPRLASYPESQANVAHTLSKLQVCHQSIHSLISLVSRFTKIIERSSLLRRAHHIPAPYSVIVHPSISPFCRLLDLKNFKRLQPSHGCRSSAQYAARRSAW